MNEKHLSELATRAARTGRTQYTRFLDPAEEREAEAIGHRAGANVRFFGGYEGAERRMAAYWSDEEPEDAPLTALELSWNAKFVSCAHRDLLGAVMALGIERDATGDICMGMEPGIAYLFCTDEMAGYLSASLESAGRAKLKVRPAESVSVAPPEGTRSHITVQTLRLDAVAAAGYKLSRGEAQKLIAAGLVKLDHIPELRSDAAVREGSLLSARGYGRLLVEKVSGETRKGRIALEVLRYGR